MFVTHVNESDQICWVLQCNVEKICKYSLYMATSAPKSKSRVPITLQSSTLFMASSISSLSRSAFAVSAWVFVPEIIDLVACNHLSLEGQKPSKNGREFTVVQVRREENFYNVGADLALAES